MDNNIPHGIERVAVQAFRRISERWKIDAGDRSRFLQVPEDLIESWFEASGLARLEISQLERISYMVGIFGALHTIFDETSADNWPNWINAAFGDRMPLDRMLDGINGLIVVHKYVLHMAYVGW